MSQEESNIDKIENETINIQLSRLGVAYLIKGLEVLNQKGASLQDSANIINLVNLLNSQVNQGGGEDIDK